MAATALSSLDDQVALLLAGDRDTIQDPYPIYDRMREQAPVLRVGSQTAIVSRHRDVKAAYRDVQRFPQPPARASPFDGYLRLLSEDDLRVLGQVKAFESNYISRKNGADHLRVRTAAHRYFTPRRVEELSDTFQRIFDELVEVHLDEDEFDFLEVAYRLPLLVICELLGVPREDAEQVKAWGDAINPGHRNPLEPALVRAQLDALHANADYVRELIERHRQNPARNDLVTSVLEAADGNRLSEEELVAFFLHTLFAGHETTQHMIGNGLHMLMVHRDQWTHLCAEPSLDRNAVDEVLRFNPPVPSINKITAQEMELRGVTLPQGTTVLLMQAAANRDPEVFERPGEFDIARQPNDHLSLGFGPHFCLGASLARLEGRIVFGSLSRRFPELDLAVDPSALRYHRGIRGLDDLPITLGPRSSWQL